MTCEGLENLGMGREGERGAGVRGQIFDNLIHKCSLFGLVGLRGERRKFRVIIFQEHVLWFLF